MEDFVAEDKIFDLVAEFAHLDHDRMGLFDPASRQIVFDATNAVEVGVETSTGNGFNLVEYMFAIAES